MNADTVESLIAKHHTNTNAIRKNARSKVPQNSNVIKNCESRVVTTLSGGRKKEINYVLGPMTQPLASVLQSTTEVEPEAIGVHRAGTQRHDLPTCDATKHTLPI